MRAGVAGVMYLKTNIPTLQPERIRNNGKRKTEQRWRNNKRISTHDDKKLWSSEYSIDREMHHTHSQQWGHAITPPTMWQDRYIHELIIHPSIMKQAHGKTKDIRFGDWESIILDDEIYYLGSDWFDSRRVGNYANTTITNCIVCTFIPTRIHTHSHENKCKNMYTVRLIMFVQNILRFNIIKTGRYYSSIS